MVNSTPHRLVQQNGDQTSFVVHLSQSLKPDNCVVFLFICLRTERAREKAEDQGSSIEESAEFSKSLLFVEQRETSFGKVIPVSPRPRDVQTKLMRS